MSYIESYDELKKTSFEYFDLRKKFLTNITYT